MELFEVGGCVRDEILGVRSNDIDFSVVFEFHDAVSVDPYKVMIGNLEAMGIKIVRDKKTGIPIHSEFLAAVGIAPKDFPNYPGRALDFVLARKESDYTDGRRPDKVEVGTLMDDLSRRDFTINAIAKDARGNFIDPFDGRLDIERRLIRTVGDPVEKFTDDALRVVRALRFAVTKGFNIEASTMHAMQMVNVLDALESNVSDERKKDELNKMFAFDTVASLLMLGQFPALTRALFSGSVSMEATMKKRKGK